jgi:hypothetical protein
LPGWRHREIAPGFLTIDQLFRDKSGAQVRASFAAFPRLPEMFALPTTLSTRKYQVDAPLRGCANCGTNGAEGINMNRRQLEECISARRQAIWEREGRRGDRPEELWERARKEIEAELAASLQGENTGFVPPVLRISQRPIRTAAS